MHRTRHANSKCIRDSQLRALMHPGSRKRPDGLVHAFRTPTTPTKAELQMDLWKALLVMGTSKLVESLESASGVARANTERLKRQIEPPPAGYPPGPSGDQVANLLAGPLEFLTKVTREHGSLVGLLLGGERVVLVTSPEAARQVMIDQAENYLKQGTAFFPGSSLAGNGLLVSDGDMWKRQRRLSNPAFRRTAVDTYSQAMVASTLNMLNNSWGAGGVRDVYADFNQLTLQITLEALFGYTISGNSSHSSHVDPDASTSSHYSSATQGHTAEHVPGAMADLQESSNAREIVGAVERAFEFFTRRAGTGMMIPEWVPTWDNLEFGVAVAQLDKVVYGIISERRAELAALEAGESSVAGLTARRDLLQGLITSKDEDGTGMTDLCLRDELMTLLVAGQETSAILLGWTCALLAEHPDIQEAAAAEVTSVLEHGTAPKASDVRRLPMVEAVVLEALRLYAPAYLVGRCSSQDTQLMGYSIEAGTTILISPYVMHRDPTVWGPDANEFRPERWSAWQQQPGYQGYMTLLSGLGPNGAYLPFGAGPRNCIGTGFAMMEAILVMAAILQRFKLKPAQPGTFPAVKPLITLRPESVGVQLVSRR